MGESHRDRGAGWKHAKQSGHKNEELLKDLVCSSADVQQRILLAAHKEDAVIVKVDIGGLNESNVPSVLGGTTKSKTDMYVYLADGSQINISIKKSKSGQVYLISTDHFISGLEKQYNIEIPDAVKQAISFYWGTAKDTVDIINDYGSKYKKYELRKRRLVATTLMAYDNNLAEGLILWFRMNMHYIFDFCFSKGLAKDAKDWADIVWYKNCLHENDIDEMFNINDIASMIPPAAEYGIRAGGTTIHLPFGFVQWHSPNKKIPGHMQFHHKYEEILKVNCSLL